jgi:peptidoglycan/LPS O-acetylase OafA/YrhL
VDALREDLRAPTRWPVLDGVRGLAVVSVVLYHAIRLLVLGEGSSTADGYSALWWPVMTGRLALDAFFVLSGFLIVASWRAVRERHGSLWRAAADYGRRRGARILPGYYLSLLILVPLVAPHLFRSPGDLALLAGVQQYLRPGLPSEVNVVYWSLTTEVHFYVLAPLVAVALKVLGARVTIAASLALAVWWQATTPGGLPQSLVFGRVDQFVLGAALAPVVAAFDKGARPRLVRMLQPRAVGIALVVALISLGVWQGAILAGTAKAHAYLLHPAVGLVMAAILLRLMTLGRPTFLEHPGLRLAGIVSYGVYLFHYPILEYGFRWIGIGARDPGPAYLMIAATITLTLVSFIVGGASYALVERPFFRRKVEAPVPQGPRGDRQPTRTLTAWPMSTATSTTSSARSA